MNNNAEWKAVAAMSEWEKMAEIWAAKLVALQQFMKGDVTAFGELSALDKREKSLIEVIAGAEPMQTLQDKLRPEMEAAAVERAVAAAMD